MGLSSLTNPTTARDLAIETIDSFSGSEKLYLRTNTPVQKSFPHHFVIIHDVGDYHRFYDPLESGLLKKGKHEVGVTRVDLKGHGLSSGSRGGVYPFDEYSEDILQIVRSISEKEKGSNIILIGQGMGALVIMNLFRIQGLAIKDLISGMVFANPCLKFRYQIPQSVLNIFKAIDRYAQGLKFPIKLRGQDITSDPERAISFDKDVLISQRLSVRLIHEILEVSQKLTTTSYFMDIPSLFLLSGRDFLADHEKTKIFIKGMPKGIATTKEYPSMLHNIFNERDRDKAIKDLYNWVKINF